MTIRDDVLTVVAVISDDPSASEDTIVERLVERGYNRLRAELLVAFVPLGFGRAVIARIPADPPIHLSQTALIQEFANGPFMEVKLAEVSEFQIARELGEEVYDTGLVPREHLGAVSGMSVELNLINDVLTANANLGGAKMAAPILLRLAETPGFEEWYQKLRAKTLNDQN